MDWNSVFKIYNKILEYEHELDILKQLGEQIAEDKRSIDIAHVDMKPTKLDYAADFSTPLFENEKSSKKGLDIESFYIELKDELALEFIGNNIKLLTMQLERLQSQLKEMETK